MQTAPKPIPSLPTYPNLLQPGSPVLLSESYAATFGRSKGIIFDLGNEKALVAYHEDYRPALVPLSELTLNLSTDTGMCHAARWLSARWLIDLGATAPQWYTTNYVWVLRSATASGVMWSTSFGRHDWAHVKVDIDEFTDPAAALAAACMALAPA